MSTRTTLSNEEWDIPARLEEVRAARRAVAAWCADQAVPKTVRDDVLLVTSELVSNAIVHTNDGVRLVLRRTDDWLRLEVSDGDPHPPLPQVGEPAESAGRGLRIVDEVAKEWGVEPVPRDGKRVWAEFQL